MSTKIIIYKDLQRLMAERLGFPGMPSLSSRQNLASALTGFLEERGLRPECTVGSTLRAGYYRAVKEHLSALRRQGRRPGYIANRKNLLSTWHRLLVTVDREHARAVGSASPLQLALLEVFAAGARVKTTARETGVPLGSLKRWLQGGRPAPRTRRYFHRLEVFFGMSPGALCDLMPNRQLEADGSQSADQQTKTIAYRVNLRKAVKLKYGLAPKDAIPSLVEEWKALLRFKTDIYKPRAPNQTYRGNLLWKLDRPKTARGRIDDWTDSVAGAFCPTAGIRYNQLRGYAGWLKLDTEKGGLGLPAADAQTLAHFANYEFIAQYLHWRKSKSLDKTSGAAVTVIQFAALLTNPQHGFLVTRPDIGARVNVIDATAWSELCATTNRNLSALLERIQPQVQKSRDPFEPIRHILAMENPLVAMADAIRRMDAVRPDEGGIDAARWARDRLLLSLTVSNPLRARNLKELTWKPDNNGQLHKDANGSWRITIAQNQFKNATGAARERPYSCPVQKSLWPFIELYLKMYRPLLAASDNHFVFAAGTNQQGVWKSLNKRYATLTKRYLHGCPGVGPHSIRHIVATAVIKRTGSFAAAAVVLHDREETVREHYGWIQGNDAARWVENTIGNLFDHL